MSLCGELITSIGLRLGYTGAVLGIFLTGCTLGPDYRRPTVLAPDNYRDATTPATAESLADLPWWELFKDPVLQGLTNEALRNNYDLRTAAARVEEARAQIGVVRSFLYPQVSLNGGGSVQQVSRLSGAVANVDHQPYVSKLGRRLRHGVGIDVFGRIRREAEAASAVYSLPKWTDAVCMITLVADVAQAYFNLREFDLELEISPRTSRSMTRPLQFYQRRLGGGVSNQLELDQAIANRSRTAAIIPESGAPDRDAGKFHQLSSRPQSRSDSTRYGANGPILSTGDSSRLAVGVARATSRCAERRAVAGGRQRQHRRGKGAVLSQLLAECGAWKYCSRFLQHRRQARGDLVGVRRFPAADFSGLAFILEL